MGDEAPSDIHHETFTSGERGEGEDHPPYTKDTIKRAIREGIDRAGEPLDLTMPRWKMSDKDLNDKGEYLKTLQKNFETTRFRDRFRDRFRYISSSQFLPVFSF